MSVARVSRSRGFWSAVALLSLPVLLLAWVMFYHYGAFFWDAKAYSCGIEAMRLTGNPNDYQGACQTYAWQYMYPPAVTALLVGLTAPIAPALQVAGYGGLYLVAVGLWVRVTCAQAPDAMLAVLATLLCACGVFAYEMATGNLAMVVAALMVCSVPHAKRGWIGLLAVALVAALFKPHYALYFLVPALVRRNLLLLAASSLALTLWYFADALRNDAAFDRWLSEIFGIIYGETHFGLLKLLELAGFGEGAWQAQFLLYGLWCLLLLGVLWRVGRPLADPGERGWLALLVATLMFPRLKEYDMLVLVPLMFWLANRLRGSLRRSYCGAVIALGFVLPWSWWAGRKLLWLSRTGELSLQTVTDLRWLVQMQGWFLAALERQGKLGASCRVQVPVG